MTTHSTLLILWFIFAGIFFTLGTIHLEESNNKIQIGDYKLPELKVAIVEGIGSGGSTVNKYAADLKRVLNDYVGKYNLSTKKQNLFAAFGYFLAFGTSLASFFATLFERRLGKKPSKIVFREVDNFDED